MKQEEQSTQDKILSSAKQEFLEKGFRSSRNCGKIQSLDFSIMLIFWSLASLVRRGSCKKAGRNGSTE